MNLLILKGFNNYFNRKIKKYSDLQDYIDRSAAHYTFTDINFNPNDGVVTEQIIGSENQKEVSGIDPEPLKWETEGSPDYIVCYETVPGTTIVDGEEVETAVDVIRYRWFVLESVRTRNGQYKLALKRDSIADHLTEILYSPCFVEKGYVGTDNPLIFNEEGVSVNQIKKSETMLKDETGIPWIVMYIAKNYKTVEENNPDGPGQIMVEKSVPIEGKMTLDKSQALDYTDLPWANIEAGISPTSRNITRRIAGAGEICISPIICNQLDFVGWGKYLPFPVRANARFNKINNQWVLDSNTSGAEKIGRYMALYDTPILTPIKNYVLTRSALNLTPANDTVRWNSTGIITPTFWRKDPYSYGELGREGVYNQNYSKAQWLVNNMLGLNTTANKNYITNYLDTKMTAYKANTSHAAVPGQDNMVAYVGGDQMFDPASNLLWYNNKIVKSDVNYYKIKIKRANNYRRYIDYFTLSGSTIVPSASNGLATHLTASDELDVLSTGEKSSLNENNNMVETWIDHAWFDVQYELIQGDLLRFTLPKPSDRTQLNDAAFDMICFPYGAIDYIIPNDGNTQDLSFISSKEASLGMARSIAAQLGDALYDMQLLPYCPYREIAASYKEDGYINFGLTTAFPYSCWSGVYKISNPGDTPARTNAQSFGIWCPQSSGTFDIEYTIEIPAENEIFDWKQFNACKKYRLVSPNYSSVFEFNPLKNKGVSVFNVDFNYRPFNPYIHIAPYFNSEGLYGVDTNDQRGLILGGDFSVGYYSDKWADYQINNANYNEIFNRQLQNIDNTQQLEREQTRTQFGWNIASEFMGLGGGLKGASAAPPGWGTLIGGIAGTVGGGAGAIGGAVLDERWLNWAQKEARSYAVDSYNLNLGNVKALPYGLAKSDALSENFKFFPFIEEYDCTDTEKWAVRAKIMYEGMTVNVLEVVMAYTLLEYERAGIDTGLDEFWFKGRMIRLESLADDFQVANDIYTEVNKGFYLYKDCVI